MKTLLTALFVALLMVGCGGPDLDDKETLDKIIAEAIDGKKLQVRGKEGEKLAYAPDEQNPYSGWTKKMHDTDWLPRPIESLWQFKDGKPDGHVISWHENGQKKGETTFKGGKKYGLETFWYENGQKEEEGAYKAGRVDGVVIHYTNAGQELAEEV